MNEIVWRTDARPSPLYDTVLTELHHHLILGFMVGTALVLSVAFVWALVKLRGTPSRYRYPIEVGAAVLFIAAASYFALIVKFVLGYARHSATGVVGEIVTYVSTGDPILTLPVRYIDWAITVPLLVIQFMAVSALSGFKARRLRSIGALAAFAMIVLGFLGGSYIADGHDLGIRYGLGAASTVFFLIVYGILIYTARKSVPEFSGAAGRSYKRALAVLMSVWFVYPVVYVLSPLLHESGWTLTLQIALCVADILSKVGFGLLIQRVVALRARDEHALNA